MVADAESAEGVCVAADCLHLLAADAASSGCCGGELFEVGTDALPQRVGAENSVSAVSRRWVEIVG
jgi:hypothetical protein